MIPWEQFKTPQDAYDWAKKPKSFCLFFTRLTSFWPIRITVWSNKDGWIRKEFSNKKKP